MPPLGELVKALRRGDRNALGRVADRIGPARLAEAIADPDSHVATAALVAAPLSRGGPLLIEAATDQLFMPDAARAGAAAAALGALLDGATPTALEDLDVPPDVTTRACWWLRGVAEQTTADLTVRLAALDALAAAVPTCGALGDLAPLARDAVPAVRRSAALVVGGSARTEAIGDGDRAVAAAATAGDCRIEGRVQPSGKIAAPARAALAKARALVSAPDTPAEDAVEMLDCLAATGSAADRSQLDGLRRGAASPVRDRAVELADPAPRGKGE